MGFFKKKASDKIRLNPQNLNVQASSNDEMSYVDETETLTYTKKSRSRRPKLPQFRRLEDMGPQSPRSHEEYIPPSENMLLQYLSKKNSEEKDSEKPLLVTSKKKKIPKKVLPKMRFKGAKKFEPLVNSDSMATTPQSRLQGSRASMSDATFDIKTLNETDIDKKVESNVEFRQFIFDEDMKKIEKVEVNLSDHSSSIFSMEHVASLTNNLQQDSKKPAASIYKQDTSHLARTTHDKSDNKSPSEYHSSYAKMNLSVSSVMSTNSFAVASKQLRPPSSLVAARDDQSVISTISDCNATVLSSTKGKESQDCFSFGVILEEGSDPFRFDTFVAAGQGSGWKNPSTDKFPDMSKVLNGPPPPPPPPPPPREIGVKINKIPSMDDALIESIRKAVRKDNMRRQARPDPEDDSTKQIDPSHQDVIKCSSDSAAAIPNPSIKEPFMSFKKKDYMVTSREAIMASMLFRQTFSESDESNLDETEENDFDDCPEDLPPAITTSESSESHVSSVTEEANAFLQKNFQHWTKHAHDVLNDYHHYRRAREETKKIEKVLEAGYANMFSFSK